MDSNDHRRRQSNPSGYASQQALLPTSSQYPATSVPDRFRPSQLGVQSPTSAPSTGRSGNIQGYSYPYGESAEFAGPSINAGSMQYQSGYEQGGQRQAQSYGQYGSNIMYNQQASPQSPYEPVPQYQQPRQSTAIEVLTNQFGVPQPYYVPGESGPTSAPSSAIGGQNVPPQYGSMSYTAQSPAGRDSMSSAYGMPDTSPSSQPSYGQSSYTAAEMDNAYGSYQAELKRTFDYIHAGKLAEAGGSLVTISDWLLGNAEALVRDDESMHSDRLKLWENFNTAWLAALQLQKDFIIEMQQTGQKPPAPRSLMDMDQMEAMGKELVRLCDNMEKHGLVDYQMGVWEEDIVTLLNACLDLLERQERSRSSSNVRRR